MVGDRAEMKHCYGDQIGVIRFSLGGVATVQSPRI